MCATQKFDLTITRLQALRFVAMHPQGAYVCAVAHEVLTSQSRRDRQTCFSSQQATRSGTGYVMPLIDAGLLVKIDTEFGWGIVKITDAVRQIIERRRG